MVALPLQKQQRTVRHVKLLQAIGVVRDPKKPPAPREPNTIIVDYSRALQSLLARAVGRFAATLLHELPGLVREADGEKARLVVNRAYEAMVAALSPQLVAEQVLTYARRTLAFNREELSKQVRAALGVDVDVTPDNALQKLVKNYVAENMSVILDVAERLAGDAEKLVTRMLAKVRTDGYELTRAGLLRLDVSALPNVELITSLPPGADKQAIAAAIESARNGGDLTRDLARDLVDRFNVATNKSKMIARDQIAKLNGQANAARQQELGITKFIWRTVNDERVRDEHRARDGKEYSYDDPPEGELPGEPINCRCYAEPVFDELVEAVEEETPPEEPVSPPQPPAAPPRPRPPVAPPAPPPPAPAPPPPPPPPAEEPPQQRRGKPPTKVALEFADPARWREWKIKDDPALTPPRARHQFAIVQLQQAKKLREHHRDMIDAYGLHNRDAGQPFADILTVQRKSGMDGASAWHASNGQIRLEQKVAKGYAAFIDARSKGVDHGEQMRELIPKAAAGNTIAQGKLDELREQVESYAVVKHEALHGAGPTYDTSYLNRAANIVIEEVTTELSARRMVRDALRLSLEEANTGSTTGHQVGNAKGRGAYHWYIEPLAEQLVNHGVAASYEDAFAKLEDAALKLKKETSAHVMSEKLAEHVDVSAAVTATEAQAAEAEARAIRTNLAGYIKATASRIAR